MKTTKKTDLDKGQAVYLKTLLHKAQHYEETHDYPLAIESYQEYINLYPRNAFVFAHLGECYRFTDNLDQAVKSLKTAVEQNPEYAWAYTMLGETYYALNDYAAAISALQKAIAYKMDDAHIYYVIGNAYCALGEFDEGIIYYDQAIGLDPNNAWFFIQRGMALISLHRFSECEKDLKKAIDLDPNHAYPYYYLGLLKETESKIEEAISAFTQCMLLEPDLLYGRRKRGALYIVKGEYELALDDFLILKQLLPDNYDVEVQIGETYFRMGRKAEAISAFKKAVKLQGQIEEPDPLLYNSIGVGYFELGYYDQAIRYYKQALKIDPTNAEVLANHANVLLTTGNLKKALTIINQALDNADEPIASIIVIRADIYRLMNEFEKALADFDQAIKLRPDYVWALSHKALTFAQLKKDAEGVKAAFEGYQQALNLEPQIIWVLLQRGDLYKRQGNLKLAQKDFQAALAIDPQYSYAVREIAEILDLQKKYSESRKLVSAFIEAIGYDTEHLDIIGGYCESAGYYDLAILCYERIWDGYRDTSEALLSLTKIYKNTFQMEKALKTCNQFIEMNPKDFQGFVYRAMIHRNLRQFEKAIEEYNIAIHLKKNIGWVYANRGLAYHSLKQHDLALADYQKAINLGYQKNWLYNRMADHYLELNQLQEAQSWIEKALVEDAADWQALFNLALIAKINQQSAEFNKFCTKAQLIAEDDAQSPRWNMRSALNLVNLYLIQGNKKKALKLISSTLDRQPPVFLIQEELIDNLGVLTLMIPDLDGLDECRDMLVNFLKVKQ